MALLDANSTAGSLAAAALESAGVDIQAQMLQWVQGDGMILAGLMFLIAIISGVFTVAAGGNYFWGRYLLIGPALFLFLTQTTDQANSTKWEFADHKFPESEVQRALKGTEYTGRGDVSLFFKFWNVFTSDVTQELMGLLNLTQDGSHLDFLTKMQRYMQLWISEEIKDPKLRQFVQLVMVNECADYYMLLMAIADIHIDQVEKTEYQSRIDKMKNRTAFTVNPEAPRIGTPMERQLVEDGVLTAGQSYTCDQLWETAINALIPLGQEKIQRVVSSNLAVDQKPADTLATLLEKVGTQRNRATGQITIEEGQLLHAVHWVIARSLWKEMTNTNAIREYYNKETHSGYFASAVPSGAFPIQNSGTNTSSAIRQFNRTETYQFKGDFVNAALAMPHFQGVGLLILAATYPFFAMAMVLPGRAGAILLWMGLWAWLKLWDVGFAVVMMIDNIMYTLFPRGPAITEEDVKRPGVTFIKLMEQDPSYNSATYYNMISVCLFAVPIVTGIFVKGAGSALIGIVRDAWRAHSTRLGGSAASFARALQGQTYVGNQRRREAELVAQAIEDTENSASFKQDYQDFLGLSALSGGTRALSNFLGTTGNNNNGRLEGLLGKLITDDQGRPNTNRIKDLLSGAKTLTDAERPVLDAYKQRKINSMLSAISANAALAEYNHSAGPGGWWASESAVAAKYYSHDTATGYPGDKLFSAMLSRQYLNQEQITGARGDAVTEVSGDLFRQFLGGASRR